jgi:hypothetical protein
MPSEMMLLKMRSNSQQTDDDIEMLRLCMRMLQDSDGPIERAVDWLMPSSN